MSGKTAVIWFKGHKEGRAREIRMSYPLARRFFSLLNPKFFAGSIRQDDDIDSIVNLLTSSDCELSRLNRAYLVSRPNCFELFAFWNPSDWSIVSNLDAGC